METIIKDLVEKLLAMQSELTDVKVRFEATKDALARAAAENTLMSESVESLEKKLKEKTNTVIYQYDKCRELEEKIEELEAKLKGDKTPAEAEDGEV